MFLVQEVKTSIPYLPETFKCILATSMMTKSKEESLTYQNTCSSWITYQKKDAEFT